MSALSILVTGASSGIGLAVVKNMLSKEHRVVAISRRGVPADMRDADGLVDVRCDLSHSQQIDELFRSILLEERIDSVVLCHGFGQFGMLENLSVKKIRGLMETNLMSYIFICRIVTPYMKRLKKGDMVFIGSESALVGRRKGSVYCASKFALRGFAQALRDECNQSGVRVHLINPGVVESSFFDNLDFQPGESYANKITTESIAQLVSLILNSPRSIVFDEVNCSPLQKKILAKKDNSL